MTVVLVFPPHPPNCEVCGGSGEVRWCEVYPGVDGDVAAGRLGPAVRCVPLPRLDVPAPSGGDAA